MLKNYWYVACTSKELGTQPIGKVICDEPVVIFRKSDKQPAILRNVCPHRQAPLSMGKVVGDNVQCAYHGMEFDGSGQCTKIPSQDIIPPRSHIRSYPVAERYGFIWIWPGTPELADEAKLPELPWREDSSWNTDVIQYFHVEAEHVLMSDNLLDLSHIAFLHETSIGFRSEHLAEDPLQVSVEGNTITTRRVIENTTLAPAHKAWRDMAEPVTRTQLATWNPPCTVNILARNQNDEESVELRADHFITPETATSHHYHIAMSRNFRVDDAELTQRLDDGARKVHTEDVDITQGQQSLRPWTANTPDMALKADKAVTASHRILKALLEAEQQAAGN